MAQKLVTKAIEKALRKAPIGSTDGVAIEDKKVLVKFFTPWSDWTWYVFEGQDLGGGDWRFFGLVDGHVPELGYFLLSELAGVRGRAGLKIERDRYGPSKVSIAPSDIVMEHS